MKVIKEKFKRGELIDPLIALKPEVECLVVAKEDASKFRTVATRLTNETGFRYSFRTEGKEVKIWKLEKE
jgi:hypothetical protein